MQHPKADTLMRQRHSALALAPGLSRTLRTVFFAVLLCAMAIAAMGARSVHAAEAGDGDFEFTLQKTDTLIGIGRRLLIDPNRWPELQKRNNIADPLRLIPGSILVIPRPLLRIDPAEVVVRSVTGPASRADGTPLVVNERLVEGAAIKTAENGYVTLQLIDGSTLRLQPRSDLKLERTRRVPGSQVTDTQMEMRSGKAEVQFKPAARKASRFEIRTGFASAAVRGTEFRVAADERGSRSEVVEGAIAFAGIPAGASQPSAADVVAVREGFGSFVDDTRKPIPPVQLLAAPFLPKPQVMQLAPNFRLRFPPITGAARYRATLAIDESMQQVRREQYFEQPDISFPNMDPGKYVLQVRAIDKFGLEGRDARVPLTMLGGQPAAAPSGQATGQAAGQATGQAAGQAATK